MNHRLPRCLPWLALALLALLLSACGGGGGMDSLADTSDIAIVGTQAGASTFIAWLQLGGASIADIAGVGYTIAPKP